MLKYIIKNTGMIFAVIAISTLILSCITSVYAGVDAGYGTEMSGLIASADTASDSTGADGSVSTILSTIMTVVRIVGITVAVLMLLVIAMKYMSAAPGEKADVKKSAVAYVVGAFVLFAATGILSIIGKFAGGIKNA